MFSDSEKTIWCSRCGVEITGNAWVVQGAIYCCQDCFQGFLCTCGDRMEQEERRSRESSFADSYSD